MPGGTFELRKNDRRNDATRGRIRKRIRKDIKKKPRKRPKCAQEGCPNLARGSRQCGKYCQKHAYKKMRTPRPAEPKQFFDASPTLSVADYMGRLCPPLQDTTQKPRDLTWEAIDSGYADCGLFPNYRDRQQREEFMDWLQSGSVFAEHHERFFQQLALDLDHFIRHAFLEVKLRRIR